MWTYCTWFIIINPDVANKQELFQQSFVHDTFYEGIFAFARGPPSIQSSKVLFFASQLLPESVFQLDHLHATHLTLLYKAHVCLKIPKVNAGKRLEG